MRPQLIRLTTLLGLLSSIAAAQMLTGCSGHTTVQINGRTVVLDGIPGGNQAQETVQQRVAADHVDRLDIDTTAGNIEVRAGTDDADAIVIQATKYVTGRQTVSELKTWLPKVKVTQRLENGALIVRSDVGEGNLPSGVGYYVSYVVTVPKRLGVTLKTISGDISASDMRGGVKANTSSGSIELSAVAGALELQTISGDITGADMPAATDITINTSSGELKLKNIAGRFAAHSVSGDITVEGAKIVGGIKAESSSGALKFSAIRADDRALDLSLTNVSGDIAYTGDATAIDAHSSSGSIDIEITDDVAPTAVNAESMSGNLTLKLPELQSARITAHTVSGALSLPGDWGGTSDNNEEGDRHNAAITLGGGATPVTLKTSSGDIDLTTKR